MLSFLDKNEVEQGSKAFGNDPIAFALSLLPQAATLAVTPVSQFNVAAIAIDKEGNFYIGRPYMPSKALLHMLGKGAQISSAILW